ncbi:arsenical pump-driving ATPase [Jeotgalibacillus haloalkalitolerans]|uniref:Arsenical pump-driving ATPase n=1 Tax=Jeotgalibacillus haloalkalitolerans TaxID=3104292 RepID=A0ABU5KRI4_9BACL|nr:arsenical pump-driving ATPase [Jeotgalibacillus sp. HH7-29]MDZ5713561.1 arsenical pump-driving ATPase [Jeotgalibacillus sp. HH7-29]
MQDFLIDEIPLTPFVFLTGKGGVGKTSTASLLAITLADQGKKILLVSTDPASNLQDVFGTDLTEVPKEIPDVPNLHVANFDPEQAAALYKEKMVGPYRGVLPDTVVQSMEEQLSGACTVEIAAFDQFTGLLSSNELRSMYDHILFDTAPTGHTLRLLSLPNAWNVYLDENTSGTSCLGPLAGLAEKKTQYEYATEMLQDETVTTLVLVARPEASTLTEAARAYHELKETGMKHTLLVINGYLQSDDQGDSYRQSFITRQQLALENMPEALKEPQSYILPYVTTSLASVADIRSWMTAAVENEPVDREPFQGDRLEKLVKELEDTGPGLVMTMGKGGVGKTTVASMIATSLTARGHRVILTTTDPAAHVDQVVGESDQPLLSVERIDPKKETERYRCTVFERAGEISPEERSLLEEDLNSPCTEEIAVFRAFADTVARAGEAYVVIDTAPTGHTLLLLDATEAYHREMERSTGEVPEAVRLLLPKLRDPAFTHVLITTLPEATPVFEASRLQDDLIRAGIKPQGWVVNQSLAVTDTRDAILGRKAESELRWIQEVKRLSDDKAVYIPWMEKQLSGYQTLLEAMKG